MCVCQSYLTCNIQIHHVYSQSGIKFVQNKIIREAKGTAGIIYWVGNFYIPKIQESNYVDGQPSVFKYSFPNNVLFPETLRYVTLRGSRLVQRIFPCFAPVNLGFDPRSWHLCALGFQSNLASAGFSAGTLIFLLHLKLDQKDLKFDQRALLESSDTQRLHLLIICLFVYLFIYLFLNTVLDFMSSWAGDSRCVVHVQQI